MSTATLSSKGQLVLPRKIRDKLQLRPGDKIDLQIEDDDTLVLRPIRRSLSELKGILPPPSKPLSLEELENALSRMGE